MNMLINTHMAEAESGNGGGFFQALGIDWRLLILQAIAFLLLVWALKKWVYPIMIGAIDKRQEAIEAGLKASQEAQKSAEAAEKKVAKEIEAARKQADDILAATQKEAAAIIGDAEEKAARRAENIVAEARADMNNQLEVARTALRTEARDLVARATEQIIGEKIDPSKDAKLVDAALKKARSEG